MSKHDRTKHRNEKGIAVVTEALDPVHRKNFMCSASLDKLLKKLVYESGNKLSESHLIREALKKAYT